MPQPNLVKGKQFSKWRVIRLATSEKRIVIDGVLSVSTYYNYGYRGTQETHYSFRLADLSSRGMPEPAVYMPRGEDADRLRKALLSNGGKARGIFTIVIRRDRYKTGAGQMLAELIDYRLKP
jgi:hypothetical protein